MRTKEEFNLVIKLKKEGKNNSEISRITKIPRGTIKDWMNNPPKHFSGKMNCYSLKNELINDNSLHEIYSYLLGLYLGDGHINKCKRTFRMRITLDKKYKNLNEHAKKQLEILFKKNKIGITNRKDGCIDFSVYNKHLPDIFPQHGKGKKHERDVSLEEWQKKIVESKNLLKGLFHSDGCFYKSNGYEYYNFGNKSKHIIDIFKECCKKLDIKYTYGEDIVRFYKKESVKKLKEIVGTKELIVK